MATFKSTSSNRLPINSAFFTRLALILVALIAVTTIVLPEERPSHLRVWGVWTNMRLDHANENTAARAVVLPGTELFRYANSTWRTPVNFILACDDFLEGVPSDHPMQLHLLFGANASQAIDPNQTAQVLHAATAYRQQYEEQKTAEPALSQCQRILPPLQQLQRRLKIAIVLTTSTGHPFSDKFGEKLLRYKREYAERHGYDLHVIDNNLANTRHKYLGSVIAILATLRFYDWVFKMDMDTLIMAPSIPLETFLDPRYELIGAIDCWNQYGMQAGVYFIRNTHWAHMFMLEVFSHSGKDVERYDELGDQALMKHLIFPYDNYAIRNHVKIVSPKWFNCIMNMEPSCPNNVGDGNNVRWTDGDFLVHTTGVGPNGFNKDKYTEEYLAIFEAQIYVPPSHPPPLSVGAT